MNYDLLLQNEEFLLQHGEYMKEFISIIEAGESDGAVEKAEEHLQKLQKSLEFMHKLFTSHAEFQKNLENFNAIYYFTCHDSEKGVVAEFKEGKINLKLEHLEHWSVHIDFKDLVVLFKYLCGLYPDMLTPVLHHDLKVKGNLNYMSKLGFMFFCIFHASYRYVNSANS